MHKAVSLPREAQAQRCRRGEGLVCGFLPNQSWGPQITPCGPPPSLAAPGCSEVN